MARKPAMCFVAMAFGHADCDDVYDRHVEPTLRSLGMSPVRVDRRQHRDDLNAYIVRMLAQADLVLADLTYARPSVYYEAGFAERAVPVVYTVRSDHLQVHRQDEDGLRVHFDLQMKKIVTWSGPDDPSFANRLSQRVRFMAHGFLQDRSDREKREQQESAFRSLSVADRCTLVSKSFGTALSRKRFWVRPLSRLDLATSWDLQPAECLVAVKLIGSRSAMCAVVTGDSITKKQIRVTIQSVSSSRLIDYAQTESLTGFDEYYYFCSLQTLPDSRFTSSFADAKPGKQPKAFDMAEDDGRSLPDRAIRVHLLQSLASVPEVRARVKTLASELPPEKTNRYTRAIARQYDTRRSYVIFSRRRP